MALMLSVHLYFSIPRPIGEVQYDGVSLVSADALDRLNDDFFRNHVQKWLRVALSSGGDLTARTRAVGGTDDLYAGSNFCPFQDPVSNQGVGHLMTLGPFPDDLAPLLADREAPHPTNLAGNIATEAYGGGTRHATRKPDARFHYTVYVDADHLGEASGDLCLKIKGSGFFAPHAESRVITIPSLVVRKAIPLELRP